MHFGQLGIFWSILFWFLLSPCFSFCFHFFLFYFQWHFSKASSKYLITFWAAANILVFSFPFVIFFCFHILSLQSLSKVLECILGSCEYCEAFRFLAKLQFTHYLWFLLLSENWSYSCTCFVIVFKISSSTKMCKIECSVFSQGCLRSACITHLKVT